MRTFSFEYLLDDRHTMMPLTLTVKARTLRKATKAAQIRLRDIVRAKRAAYWQYEMDGFDAPVREVYVPYHHLRGHLYPGWEVKPMRRIRIDHSAERREAHRALLDKASPHPEAVETFASFLSPILQSVIADAPSYADLFSAPLPEVDPSFSIPLVITSPMPRDLWPSARRSRHLNS